LDTSVSGGREVFVGWDEGLQTFFAQVIDGADNGEENMTLDLGNAVGDITDAAVVLDAVRPYADVPGIVEILLPNMSTPAISDTDTGGLIDTDSLDAVLDITQHVGYLMDGSPYTDDDLAREDDPLTEGVTNETYLGWGY